MRLKGNDQVASMDIIPAGLRKEWEDVSESYLNKYFSCSRYITCMNCMFLCTCAGEGGGGSCYTTV